MRFTPDQRAAITAQGKEAVIASREHVGATAGLHFAAKLAHLHIGDANRRSRREELRQYEIIVI
jgi:hypothetical protein